MIFNVWEICCGLLREQGRKRKSETHSRGDRINYPDEVATPTADLLTIKLMLNCIISTPNARWMTLDIKIFYLNTPLKKYKYLKHWLSDLPEDVIQHYELKKTKTRRIHLRQGLKRKVWPSPSRTISTRIFRATVERKRVLPIKIHTGTVDSWKPTNTIHVSGRQFWNQVCWSWKCNAIDRVIESILFHLQGEWK